jgi:hypothetical protein
VAELNGDTIRTAREAAGWSIGEAVREMTRRSPEPLPDAMSLVRSWKRWERGTTPSRAYRSLLAGLLGLDEPAPEPARVELAGDWWAAWQSSRDRNEVLAVQPVQFWQQGDEIRMKALRRGRPIDQGGYLWRGEMRLWDNEILMGWYAAKDGSVRSKGTVYFVVNPQGRRMTGRWVGLSWDGNTVTGLAAMTRTEDETRSVIAGMIEEQRRGRDL